MKLWLVVIKDKSIGGEPDIGFAVIEGNERAAKDASADMERSCIMSGRARCVARYRELERGKHYRAMALLRTG